MIQQFFREGPVPIRILSGPFCGARLILNPKHSKRKILGLYEHILNPWLMHSLPSVEVVWDVGANDGYFTYGCAHVMQKYQGGGYVVAFEPEVSWHPVLTHPAQWKQYQKTNFEFLPRFVGSHCRDITISLDHAYRNRPFLHSKTSLIKVDVEGNELEVLAGAKELLQSPHFWIVEVHGKHLLEPVLKFFSDALRKVHVILYQPHWLLGAETRTIETCWVVTD